jgi:3-hydroxybutyryl-CoA dehydrogenase
LSFILRSRGDQLEETRDPDALSLMAGLMADARRLADRGIARPSDIDLAMRLGAGHPRGPFELGGASPGLEADGTAAPPGVAWTGPVGIVGSGHMAVGIAEAVARSGRTVRMVARSGPAAEDARSRVAGSLDRAVSRGRLDAAAAGEVLDRLTVATDTAVLVGTDVVVEAVAEDLDVKRAVVADLDHLLPVAQPIATNTSSFRVVDLADSVRAARPLLALHFFNPAPVMRLVEVAVPADRQVGEALTAAAQRWVRDLGKTPVVCADRRGFVVNRLLIPFLNDAVRLHERGVAAADVDELMRSGAGHPMGPLELIDLIGLDVTVAALDAMAAVEEEPRLRPAALLRALAAEGRLGRKSGSGFHVYPRPVHR